MRYYSDMTKQLYDTPEQLAEAEKAAGTQPVKRMAKAPQDEPQVPTKKELASAVEAAEAKVAEARANLELAKQKAEDMSKKFLEELDGILEPAKQQLKDAQQARYEAIRRFNDAYGVYTTSYTGARAADEFARSVADMTSFFPRLFRF